MSTIKHYEQERNGEYVPVGSSKVYTLEEYWEMLANGKWTGGNVVGLGYVMGEVDIYPSATDPEDSEGDNDSDFSSSDNDDDDTPGGGNPGDGNSSGGNSSGGNSSGDNSSGSNSSGDNSSGSNSSGDNSSGSNSSGGNSSGGNSSGSNSSGGNSSGGNSSGSNSSGDNSSGSNSSGGNSSGSNSSGGGSASEGTQGNIITITGKTTGISSYTYNKLKNLSGYSGEIHITSVARTPEEQARAMLNNIKRSGVQSQIDIYALPGENVIRVYNKNLSDSENIRNMTAKIYEEGPSNVSRHCADFSVLNVFDVSRKHLSDIDAFIKALRALNFYVIDEPSNKCVHVEIPQ